MLTLPLDLSLPAAWVTCPFVSSTIAGGLLNRPVDYCDRQSAIHCADVSKYMYTFLLSD
jgi:hypothetical protein